MQVRAWTYFVVKLDGSMQPLVAHEIADEVVPADNHIALAAGFPYQQQSFIVVPPFQRALNMLGYLVVVIQVLQMLLNLPSDRFLPGWSGHRITCIL